MTAVEAIAAGWQLASTVAQAGAASKTAHYQAQAASNEAALARQISALDESRLRDRQRALAGRQAARLGKSGVVLEGTPLDVSLDDGAAAEFDALQLRHGGLLDGYRADQQSALSRMRAGSAIAGGFWNVGGQILNGGRGLLGPGLSPWGTKGP
ncbi:MAG: hypothetical protein ACKVSF_11130 [Alphaproteobacteria bacterium]